MKRPLAAIGLIYLSALAAAVCLASTVNFTTAIMAAIIGIAASFFMREHRVKILIITIPIVIGFGVMSFCQSSAENISAKLGENTCVISGEVSEIPYEQYGRWYYVVTTDYVGIHGAPQKVKIRLTCRTSIEAKEGDKIDATVTFIQNSDEFGYDNETSLRANGIQARAWCSPYVEPEVIHGKNGLKYLPMKIRRATTKVIRKSLPQKYSSMLCAMLLGDVSYLDSKITENFRATGISHLLAISGLHVSLLTYCVMSLLRNLRLPVKLNISLTMAFILMFMAVTGFSPSVTRAGIMHLTALTARLLMRDADNLTSLSLSLLIMCILNPWSAADIGLQMSVCSTLGLICAADRLKETLIKSILTPLSNRFSQCKIVGAAFNQHILNKNIKDNLNTGHFGFITKLKSYIIEALIVSITASICTMPLSAIYFGRISLISPITNVMCVYTATLFIIIGAIAAILSQIPLIGWIIAFLPKLAAIILGEYLDLITSLLKNIPLSSVNSSYDYIPYFFLFALLIVLSVLASAKYINKPSFTKKAINSAFCAIFALLLISMTSHMLTSTGGEIIIFDMQDGGVCVCAKNRTHAIISETGGSSYDMLKIDDILNRKGIQKIDAAAVSNKSKERSMLSDEIIEKYAPDYFAYGGEISDYPFAEKAAKTSRTQLLPFGGTISIQKLNLSLEMYVDSNADCWQFLHCNDTDILICPPAGDCALLPKQYRVCDAVIIGDSEVKNIICLTVGAAIITSEPRTSAEISAKLRVKGLTNIYATSQNGTIICAVNKGKLYVQTSK